MDPNWKENVMKRLAMGMGACLLLPVTARAGLILSVEAPGVQTSQVAGVTTENFESIALGQYVTLGTAVGNFNAVVPGLKIIAADQFGGAGGAGQYFVVGLVGGTTQADLDLGGQKAYVGMWLSALDPTNIIELYSGGSLVASYNAATVHSFLPASYNGNPNPPFLGQDSNEPFAYLNFIGTGGTTFDTVRFKNASTSGLEIDNISVRTAEVQAPLPGTIVDGGVTAVPLPSAILGGLPLLGFLVGLKIRRRRA
jgi:hypothetical protein